MSDHKDPCTHRELLTLSVIYFIIGFVAGWLAHIYSLRLI